MPFKRTVGWLRDVPSLAAAPEDVLNDLANDLIAFAEVFIDEYERTRRSATVSTVVEPPSASLSVTESHEILTAAESA